MYKIVPFKEEHLASLMGQRINAYLPEWVRSGHAGQMESTEAFTLLIDGEVMMCGGVAHIWEHRGQIWSIFSERAKTKPVQLFRAMKEFIDSRKYRRLEMAIPCDIGVAHKRARLLGFKMECPRAVKYLPNGVDCSLYARIKDGK